MRPQLPERLPAGKGKGKGQGKASGAPDGEGWLHEIQYDGCRIMARVEEGRARLVDEKGKDVEGRFEHIAAAIAGLGVKSALLDGEVAVLLPDGRTSIQALQNATKSQRRGGTLVYFLFDLLYLDGRDIRALPMSERKDLLLQTLDGAPPGGW